MVVNIKKKKIVKKLHPLVDILAKEWKGKLTLPEGETVLSLLGREAAPGRKK